MNEEKEAVFSNKFSHKMVVLEGIEAIWQQFVQRKEETMSLADKTCIPCRGGVPPLEPQKIQELLGQLDTGWSLNAQGHLEKTYTFENFAEALAFTNRVGNIAELEGHHPDLYLAWGKCKVEIWTHKIQGLTESDFYLAAKADRAFQVPTSH